MPKYIISLPCTFKSSLYCQGVHSFADLQAPCQAGKKQCVSTYPTCRLPTMYYGSNPGPRKSIAQGIIFNIY